MTILARTWLFVPGNMPLGFAKAAAAGGGAIILDLEDAVTPDGRDAARQKCAIGSMPAIADW